MKNSFFTNENQLSEWIEASKGIKDSFGINKALGYLIGEKFYSIIHLIYSYRKMLKIIEEQKKKPDYNAIQKYEVEGVKLVTNLDEDYEQRIKGIKMAKKALVEFSKMIKETFAPHEIGKYFDSNPRFGIVGHTISEDEYRFLIEKGTIEHSLETEVEDALIYGEMREYLF